MGFQKGLPIFITESNLSSTPGEAYMDNFAGLWLADYIGSFLAAGGNGVYYFHYVPVSEDLGCGNSPGTFGMFHVDKDYTKLQPLAQFFASELINKEWIQPGNGTHEMFPALANLPDGVGHELLTAYALKRPDGQWSLMLVNRDQDGAHKVSIAFRDTGKHLQMAFAGDVAARGLRAWTVPMGIQVQCGRWRIRHNWRVGDHNQTTEGQIPMALPSTKHSILLPATRSRFPAASIMVIRGNIKEEPFALP